jgi:hypothetical protein
VAPLQLAVAALKKPVELREMLLETEPEIISETMMERQAIKS